MDMHASRVALLLCMYTLHTHFAAYKLEDIFSPFYTVTVHRFTNKRHRHYCSIAHHATFLTLLINNTKNKLYASVPEMFNFSTKISI